MIVSCSKIVSEVEANLDRKNKIIDESWDFKKANTKEYTHCFHAYPAMMIPQVARRLIENFGKNAKVLFDPYCGTGTSLVEANLFGINAIGTDINPLARLIAKTKTTVININELDSIINDFTDYIFSINFGAERVKSVIIPQVKNMDYWFSKNVQLKLGIILGFIENISDAKIQNFFKVAFSETVRETSFVKQGEFKLVKDKNLKENDDKDVFGTMIAKLTRNKTGLLEFINAHKNNSFTEVYDFNTVYKIPEDIIKSNSIDIIVTSPPYGDSRTTVAYGQYSRFSNEWLGFNKANQIDKMLMGGEKRKNAHIFKSDILNDVINEIQKKDKERARDVISFYEDYEKSINNISATVKPSGFVCYVVGNRTVKGVNIPTDEITAELFESNGFTHIETIVRNIPNKRMPLKNSPTNIIGETSTTMRNEFIVICQKN
ncbi:MAG: DNA methyltransferase [Melioribacter sp.]|uniref:DNA methyltransferase n=1 Tax=Rosettibacter primus TaxID=3111523 RepID=UPI00247C5C02|nr:DNA methyltransferase [Melioribacter sp.]